MSWIPLGNYKTPSPCCPIKPMPQSPASGHSCRFQLCPSVRYIVGRAVDQFHLIFLSQIWSLTSLSSMKPHGRLLYLNWPVLGIWILSAVIILRRENMLPWLLIFPDILRPFVSRSRFQFVGRWRVTTKVVSKLSSIEFVPSQKPSSSQLCKCARRFPSYCHFLYYVHEASLRGLTRRCSCIINPCLLILYVYQVINVLSQYWTMTYVAFISPSNPTHY